jgi:hypothetical protein
MGLTGHRSALDLMPVVREGCVNSKENMFRFGRNAMPRVAKTGLMLALASLLMLPPPASSQDWPTRPMTMVIPFSAAGGVDIVGRILGARMAEILGRPIFIENIGGAGGMWGSSRVA